MMSDIVDSFIMLTGAEYRKMMAEIAASNHFAVKYLAHIDEQNVEVARLTAENAKLREVLEPFAKAAHGFDSYNIKDPEEWFAYSGVKSADGTTGAITVGDLRRARAELSGDKHE